MSRLFEAQIQQQLVEAAKANVNEVFKLGQGQLVTSIETYLPLCPAALIHYAGLGCVYLKNINQIADQAKKPTETLNAALDLLYAGIANSVAQGKPLDVLVAGFNTTVIAIYGMLSEMAMVGVEIAKDVAPTPVEEGRSKPGAVHIYIGSISILKRMQRDRFFVSEIDADEEKAFARKILKALESNLIYGMRLDIDHIYEGKPVYKPTKPRGGMLLENSLEGFKLFPAPIMYPVADLFTQIIGDDAFRFVENRGGDGIATRVCSFDAKAVRKVYAGNPTNLIDSIISRSTPGYSIIYNTFKAYNLQGSLHERGYSSFRLDRLINISAVNIDKKATTDNEETVDKTLHTVNPEFLRGIFITKANGFKTEDFMDLAYTPMLAGLQGHFIEAVGTWTEKEFASLADPEFNPSSYPNNSARAKALILQMQTKDATQLFVYMSSREKLFGTVKKPPFNPLSYANNPDRAAALIAHMQRMDTPMLYGYMDDRPQLFGKVKQLLDTREKVSSKMLKKLTLQQLPVDEMHREAFIRKLLSEGLVKLTTRSTKSESEKVVLASNNKDVLQRLVGKGYVKKYGSDGVRLRAFVAQLKTLPNAGRAEIEALAGEWRVLDRLAGTDFSTLSNVLDAVSTTLTDLREPTEAPGLIGYKNCTPHNSGDFYKRVYASDVSQCEFAPFE